MPVQRHRGLFSRTATWRNSPVPILWPPTVPFFLTVLGSAGSWKIVDYIFYCRGPKFSFQPPRCPVLQWEVGSMFDAVPGENIHPSTRWKAFTLVRFAQQSPQLMLSVSTNSSTRVTIHARAMNQLSAFHRAKANLTPAANSCRSTVKAPGSIHSPKLLKHRESGARRPMVLSG